jgi:hypothetical protein
MFYNELTIFIDGRQIKIALEIMSEDIFYFQYLSFIRLNISRINFLEHAKVCNLIKIES